MVFASLAFLYIFLPLNLILYYVSKNSVYRNVLLTLFSFVFYAWGEPVWVLLLIFSSMVDFGNALFIERFRGTKWAKFGVVSTVIFNAGILMAFKYSGFIVSNINSLFSLSLPIPDFKLPIGISFYTFQTLSYVIDVYRNEVKAQRDPMKFLMFVSLYHQLVAGPIVRYSHIAHEIDNRKFNIGDISAGVGRFCVGLFKKVCIANVAGSLVDKYMLHDFAHLSVGEAWFGVIMYSLQIYFDFSGYSDMAIGLGRMFGFHYHENFSYPYIAKSATEFWRRWHISLGTFFRDYIYIPMGGNRGSSRGTWIFTGILFGISAFAMLYTGIANGNWHPLGWGILITVVLLSPSIKFNFGKKENQSLIDFAETKLRLAGVFNLFFVWFFTGMWHGAFWNYILWGLYFGLLIYIERLFLMKILKKIPAVFAHIYMLFAAVIGWAIFYFTDTNRLRDYLKIMFGQTKNDSWNFALTLELRENMFWLAIAFTLCLPVYMWFNRGIRHQIVRKKRAYFILVSMVFNLILLFLATSMLVGKSYNPFIYYRF